MRQFICIVESLYDEPDETANESTGSYGWWVYPDGTIEEMETPGDHGVTAAAWLSNNEPNYMNDDYDEAIEIVLLHGGVRVATFHGSDSMHLRYLPSITLYARSALLKLMRETRADFIQYFIGDEMTRPSNYREAIAAVRKA